MSPAGPPHICSRCGAVVPWRQTCACRPAWEGSTHPGGSRQWRALRAAKLRANPICEHPGCRLPAYEVDHIAPLAAGGMRYDWRNLASLCHDHHVEKTTLDAQLGRRRAR